MTDQQAVIKDELCYLWTIFHIWRNPRGAEARRARLEAIARALINHDRRINGEITRRGYVIRPQ